MPNKGKAVGAKAQLPVSPQLSAALGAIACMAIYTGEQVLAYVAKSGMFPLAPSRAQGKEMMRENGLNVGPRALLRRRRQ